MTVFRGISVGFLSMNPSRNGGWTIDVRERGRDLLDIRFGHSSNGIWPDGILGYDFCVAPHRGMPLGPFSTELEVDISQSGRLRKRFLLPVSGEVIGPLKVAPRSLILKADIFGPGDLVASFSVLAENGFILDDLTVGLLAPNDMLCFGFESTQSNQIRTVVMRAKRPLGACSGTIVFRCGPDLNVHVPYAII
jgi:hypothetical protein